MMGDKFTRVLLRVVIAVCLPAVAAMAHAENKCPWLNEATAGGLLGGDAVGAFTAAANNQPAVCTFMQKEGKDTRELMITVEVNPDAHTKLNGMMQACGASSQLLQAIGNEAAVCAMDSRKRAISERVVGRVRDQIFTITISSTVKDDMVLNASTLMTKIYTASEQVAGNLF